MVQSDAVVADDGWVISKSMTVVPARLVAGTDYFDAI